MKTLLLLALAAAALPFSALAETPKPAAAPAPLLSTEMSGQDIGFLKSAVELGELQTALSKLAESRAETAEIRLLGKAIALDQAAKQLDVQALAAKKSVPVPHAAPLVQTTLKKLGKLTGPKFDKLVMEEIIAVQERRVLAFESGLKSADKDLHDFAYASLPSLKEQLLLARRITGTSERPVAKFRTESSGTAPLR